MRFIFIFLLCIFMTTCSSMISVNAKSDQELQDYVYGFVSESNGKITLEDIKDVEIFFKDYPKDSEIIGTCYLHNKNISINKAWWKEATPMSKMEVVYHELGHCVLWKSHTIPSNVGGFFGWLERLAFKLGIYKPKGYLSDGCPSSIMHPYTIDDFCMMRHYSYYITELYTRKP